MSRRKRERDSAKLEIVQKIIQLNDTLITEVTRWIGQIDEIDTILKKNTEVEEKDMSMSFGRKNFSRKYEELFKSIQKYDDDLKDRLRKLKESLERENKVLTQVLSEVSVREVTISASLFISIVEHNKEQVRIYTDLHRNYWNSFFGGIKQVVGAFEEEVSEDSRLFVEKFNHLCDVFRDEYREGKPSIEELFHNLIGCVDILNRYIPDNNSKEVFKRGIEDSSAKKFADNYFNSRNVQNQIFSNKNKTHKLVLKARDGFNAQGIDDGGRKKLKKFTKEALTTLFDGIEEFKGIIRDLKVGGGDDEDSSHKVDSETLERARVAVTGLYSLIQAQSYDDIQKQNSKGIFYERVFEISKDKINKSFFEKLVKKANGINSISNDTRTKIEEICYRAKLLYKSKVDDSNSTYWKELLESISVLLGFNLSS